MAGVLSGLHQFGPDTGPEALSLLDGNYGLIAAAINFLGTYDNYYVDSGAVNAAIVVIDPAQTASLNPGTTIVVKMAATNTIAAPTLNLAGLGPRTITDINGATLVASQLFAGVAYTFIYNGSAWACQNINNFGTGTPLILKVSKSVTTSRNTTIVAANDPDLSIPIPSAGRWAYELVAYVTEANGGLNYGLNFSGTYSGVGVIIPYVNATGGIGQIAQAATAVQLTVSTTFSITHAQFAGATVGILLKGSLATTSGGNLALSWCQNVSNAANTNMLLSSYMTLTAVL